MNTAFLANHAMAEIFSTYGDYVSIGNKKKSLNKFGRTANADAGVKTTVAEFQDDVVNETYATANTIDRVVSTSGSDTETIKVEGHYFNDDGDFVFAVQNVTLTGQTPATLSQALCRCTRLYVPAGTAASPASDLVGNIAAYDSAANSGLTSGKPDTDASVKCMIVAGQNQSAKCATTISVNDYWILTRVVASLSRATGSNVNANVDVEFRERYGVFRPVGLELDMRRDSQDTVIMPLEPYLIIPKNTDVRMVIVSDTANTLVSGSIHGFLAEISS